MSRSIQQARSLRANMTDAESALWRILRNRQLNGHRFRLQVPLGEYIVDFACFDPKLVVELDGRQHAQADHRAADETRTSWLEGEGFLVLRFWNNDVLRNIDGVAAEIATTLAKFSESSE